jgi:hypothetical protein
MSRTTPLTKKCLVAVRGATDYTAWRDGFFACIFRQVYHRGDEDCMSGP